MASKKFELAKKELELKNQLAVLKNEQIVELPDWAIQNWANSNTVGGLEYNIKKLQEAIEKQEWENKVALYWEEHQKEYNELQDLRDWYRINFNTTNRRCVEEMNRKVFGHLNLIVSSLYFAWDDTKIEVGIPAANAVANKETGCTPILFGHDFEVFYRTKYDYKRTAEEKREVTYRVLEMNYGTMGSFDVMNDTSRIQALAAMGLFAGDEVLKDILVSIIENYEAEINKIRQEVAAIDNKLANPFA